ncbi:MAG: hypothetical protein RSD88_03660 [Anaerovoracaceae bacterium]
MITNTFDFYYDVGTKMSVKNMKFKNHRAWTDTNCYNIYWKPLADKTIGDSGQIPTLTVNGCFLEDSKYPIEFLTNGTVPLKTASNVEITNSKFKNNEVNIYFSEETPNLHMNVLVKNNEFTGGRIAGIPNNAIFDSNTFTNTTKRSYAIQYLFNKDTGPANCKLVNNTFNTDYALQYMPYHNHSGAGGATETERKAIAKSELPEMNKNKFKN